MTGKDASVKHPHRFIESSPCPYFDDGRVSTTEFICREGWLSDLHEFLAGGYRRIGSVIYTPLCVNCSECKPLRIDTDTFIMSRSQKRIIRKNRDIRVEINSPSHISHEKLDLFVNYQKSKHGAGEKEHADFLTHLSCIHYGHERIVEMDFFLGNRLVGVGIIDEAADSLSSTYFYYNTSFLDRQLGTFSIIQEILLARDMGKKFYYLGYYIEGSSKMSYKKFFRPNQVLLNGSWRDFSK